MKKLNFSRIAKIGKTYYIFTKNFIVHNTFVKGPLKIVEPPRKLANGYATKRAVCNHNFLRVHFYKVPLKSRYSKGSKESLCSTTGKPTRLFRTKRASLDSV